MKTKLATYLVPLMLMSAGSIATAQQTCEDVFSQTTAAEFNGALDPDYADVVRSWNQSWLRTAYQRLVGNTAPSTEQEQLKMTEFLKAREFRSWFEAQNRMRERMAEKAEPAPTQTKLLIDPREALKAKLMAIRQAKHTIDFTYYIVRNDTAGRAYFEEIRRAIKRGVSVRVMVDSTGSLGMAPHSDLRALIDFAERNGGPVVDASGNPTGQRAKVEIVVFNPITSTITNVARESWRWVRNLTNVVFGFEPVDQLAFSLNRRTHDKILLIDGAFGDKSVAFTGGRNIAKQYYAVSSKPEDVYVDFEVMMKGTSLPAGDPRVSFGTQMSEYFDTIYYHLGNKQLSRTVWGLAFGYEKQLRRMGDAARRLRKQIGIDMESEQERAALLDEGFSDSEAEVIHTFHNMFRTEASRKFEIRDYRSVVQNGKALMAKIEQLIAKENEEVVIITPYLWLSDKQIRLLKSWLLKDPNRKLTLLTNSIMTSDNMPAQILVDNILGPKLALDQGLTNAKGEVVRRSISDQVKIYQYGRLDSKDLGGKAPYGKLHAKGVLLKGSGVSVIGTFNNDPRSLLLNSEGAAVIYDRTTAEKFDVDIERLKAESHLYGSDEYHAIRSHKKLPGLKRMAVDSSKRAYDLMIRLKLWWII